MNIKATTVESVVIYERKSPVLFRKRKYIIVLRQSGLISTNFYVHNVFPVDLSLFF